jgi:hypothetical protein
MGIGILRLREPVRFAHRLTPLKMTTITLLLQAKAFAHEALEAGFVEEVVGEFLVGEHGEGGAFGAGGEFGGFFDGEAGVLADDGRDHAHHDLKAADSAGFVGGVLRLGFIYCERWIFLMFRRFPSIHAAPFRALVPQIWM